jgi:hypothetical protein
VLRLVAAGTLEHPDAFLDLEDLAATAAKEGYPKMPSRSRWRFSMNEDMSVRPGR